jgi:ATP-dependent Lon protease
VLDPEQNHAFYDNYVEQDFDLSRVMFIATANALSYIQPALRDRLEIIHVTGYTTEEKIEISKRHLVPRVLEDHGVTKAQVVFSKEVLEKVIEDYTSESGVRGLEKQLAKIVRNKAKSIAMNEKYDPKISLKDIAKILGPEYFQKEKYQDNQVAGVVTGLAWTSVGGDILFIEVSLSKGKSGRLTLTGNLGDVMKESAVIAMEYLRSHAQQLKMDARVFDEWNVHVHVPEGATPKDGPSAGVTMLTAIASAFTQRKVRAGLAMTGEITLRGKVLPVGGIKEKILAARRAGITDVILAEDNKKDIQEIKKEYISAMKFHYVTDMEQVLKIALLKEKVKNPLDIGFMNNEKKG